MKNLFQIVIIILICSAIFFSLFGKLDKGITGTYDEMSIESLKNDNANLALLIQYYWQDASKLEILQKLESLEYNHLKRQVKIVHEQNSIVFNNIRFNFRNDRLISVSLNESLMK